MAVGPFTNALVVYGEFDISGDLNTVQVDEKADMLERTVFGDTTRRFQAGLRAVEVAGSGFVDFDTTTTPPGMEGGLFAEIGAAQKNLSFAPAAVDGSVAYVTKGVSDSFAWNLTPSELGKFDWAVKGNRQLGRGHLLQAPTNETATLTTAIQETGATLVTQSMVCNLHVIEFDGTSLDVVVYSNDTNDEVTPTAVATFAQATGLTSEQIVDAGAVTDTYWYAVLTFTGTSFKAAVAIGITDNA